MGSQADEKKTDGEDRNDRQAKCNGIVFSTQECMASEVAAVGQGRECSGHLSPCRHLLNGNKYTTDEYEWQPDDIGEQHDVCGGLRERY